MSEISRNIIRLLERKKQVENKISELREFMPDSSRLKTLRKELRIIKRNLKILEIE